MNIQHPVPPNQRGWGSGWPHCELSKMVKLDYPSFAESALIRGEVRELIVLLLHETVKRGYSVDRDVTDDWAFACRDIKRPDGTTTGTPSNHSWGLAVDINATRNPNTSGKLVTDMPRWMVALWNDYGFRWGGDFMRLGGSTNDAMHYEFCGTPAEAAALTKRARQHFGGGDDDMNLEKYADGQEKYAERHKQQGNDAGPPPDDRDKWFKKGWNAQRAAMNWPKSSGG